MNEKTKSVWMTILYFVLYVVLVLVAELPGFASPYYWVCVGIVAAFLAAGPLTMCIEKTESALLLPVAWFFVNRAIGEIGMDLMQVGNLFLLTAGAVLSLVLKNNKRLMMRVCVPVLVAMPSCNLLPLYFQTELFTGTALGEMSPEYVATLAKCAHGWVFVLVTVLVIGAGVLSERVTEKLFVRK